MPSAGDARSRAFRVAAQAYGATTHIPQFQAHRQGRLHRFGTSPKHARRPRYGGSERWNGDCRLRHRPFPHRPTICRRNVNRRPAGSRRHSPMRLWRGADAGLQTGAKPVPFVSSRVPRPRSNSIDSGSAEFPARQKDHGSGGTETAEGPERIRSPSTLPKSQPPRQVRASLGTWHPRKRNIHAYPPPCKQRSSGQPAANQDLRSRSTAANPPR